MTDHVLVLILVDTPTPRAQTLAPDHAIGHGTTQRTPVRAQLASQICKLHVEQYRVPYDRYRASTGACEGKLPTSSLERRMTGQAYSLHATAISRQRGNWHWTGDTLLIRAPRDDLDPVERASAEPPRLAGGDFRRPRLTGHYMPMLWAIYDPMPSEEPCTERLQALKAATRSLGVS